MDSVRRSRVPSLDWRHVGRPCLGIDWRREMLEVDGAYCDWQDEMEYSVQNQEGVRASTVRIPEMEQASTRGT